MTCFKFLPRYVAWESLLNYTHAYMSTEIENEALSMCVSVLFCNLSVSEVLLSCVRLLAEVLWSPLFTKPCLTQGHNLGVRRHCSLTFISLPVIPQSFPAATLVVLCLQPGHRQLGLPLISPSHPSSCQSIYPSINPSIHYIARIKPRTDNPSISLLFFFHLLPSITPLLYTSIHRSALNKKT